MERRSDDPAYQMHEMKRPTRERGGPRTDADGQEDQAERDDDSSQAVNRRLNMGASHPEAVREREREHDSPNAVPPEREE